MPYCRFSSNDHQCDLYVYESPDGWTVHAAAHRHVMSEPMPPPVDAPIGTDAWVDQYARRIRDVSDVLDRSPLAPIGGPHDGSTFIEDSPGECADRVQALSLAGYRVPAEVVAILREEQDELDDGRER